MKRLLPLLLVAAFAAPHPALAESGGGNRKGAAASTAPAAVSGIDFGDDSSTWAHDGECDDPRFRGEGMSAPPLLAENEGADAADCGAAFKAGSIQLRPAKITSPAIHEGIDFGTDSSEWAQDGECDDSRFRGEGMTATPLLDQDIRANASDCLEAFKAGRLELVR